MLRYHQLNKDFRNPCLGQTHSERLLLFSHFTWKPKFGVLSSVQMGRLHAFVEDCKFLVKQMETLSKDIYEKKQRHRYFTGAVGQTKELATHCWICETTFCADHKKVLDRCQKSLFESVFWLGSLKVQPTAQNTQFRTHTLTQLVSILLASCCKESSSLYP